MKQFFYCFATIILLGSVKLSAQNEEVKEEKPVELAGIEVFASYSKNANKEPVTVSTINHQQIESKISNLEFPEILRFVPSTYVSRKGGGYGDSRINLRGFASDNVGLTINGIPVNGMENGAVYWSNWASLADVAASVQVQRGIGLSNRALPSVGGTINILTLGTQAQKQGSIFYGIGNDGYDKLALTFSTGQIKGWTFTFSGSRTKGNGYVYGTDFEAWSYFGELSKKINSNHTLSLTAFGAPQWHNGGGYKQKISVYENSSEGIRYNKDYGYLNGKIVSTSKYGYNEYHKPQIALNHYWTIDDRSSLMTSVYASVASGGGQVVYGLNKKTPDGLTDFEAIMKENATSETGSTGYLTMSTNSHDWYGLISTYSNLLTDNLTLRVGFDGRYYKGYHYEEISNLLGGAYYLDKYGLAYREKDAKLKVGDRLNYDYVSRIMQYGAFSELVYEKSRYKAFMTFALSDYAYQREDPGKYGLYSNQDIYPVGDVKTSWRHFIPVTVKGGFNFNVVKNHRVFVNAAYITRAPKMDNIYVDNVPLSDPVMEKVITTEIGYGFHNRYVDVLLNGYYTRWNDKSTTFTNRSTNERMCIPNVDANHMGIELEVAYRPLRTLRLGGYFSIGEWKWANDVYYTKIDAQHNRVETFNAYIKDLHVGDAPQTGANLNAEWEIYKGLKIAADFNYYARYYANFYPDARTNPDDRQDSWRLPDFGTIDLRAEYRFQVGPFSAIVYGNVNNLFDKHYISEAQDGTGHTENSATVWYGFGRTWTTGVKFMF